MEQEEITFRERFIAIGTEKLHYLETGDAPQLLIAFHGYGHDCRTLQCFVPMLVEKYTCLLFDLPHHGHSEWQEHAVMHPAWLKTLFTTLMKTYPEAKISLLGYSIGARICLSLVEQCGAHIDKVTLMAPDGININPYYYFFTNNIFGELVFRQAMQTPALYFPMASWLNNLGILHPALFRYVQLTLGNPSSRKLLSVVWPSLREILPSQTSIRSAIENNGIKLSVFAGKKDRLIPPETISNFCNSIKMCDFYIIDKGHRIFDNSNIPMIAKTLL